MKEKILKLRSEGKSYKQIIKILGCSSSTVSYHCGDGQKEKCNNRHKKRTKQNSALSRVSNWHSHYVQRQKNKKNKARDFQRREGSYLNNREIKKFNFQDVLNKFGEETFCYLSGEKINIVKDKDYCFDHIIPSSKGGSNDFDNLGIVKKEVNRMKDNMYINELLEWCVKILRHNNYIVHKRKKDE